MRIKLRPLSLKSLFVHDFEVNLNIIIIKKSIAPKNYYSCCMMYGYTNQHILLGSQNSIFSKE